MSNNEARELILQHLTKIAIQQVPVPYTEKKILPKIPLPRTIPLVEINSKQTPLFEQLKNDTEFAKMQEKVNSLKMQKNVIEPAIKQWNQYLKSSPTVPVQDVKTESEEKLETEQEDKTEEDDITFQPPNIHSFNHGASIGIVPNAKLELVDASLFYLHQHKLPVDQVMRSRIVLPSKKKEEKKEEHIQTLASKYNMTSAPTMDE